MDPNHVVRLVKERENRVNAVWHARERCLQVLQLAESTNMAGRTTPVGWCTKKEAEHLMGAPSAAGTGGIFVGVGDFGLFPSWGTCGGDPVPTTVVPRAAFIQDLLEPLRQFALKPHHHTDSTLELVEVIEKLLRLP